MTTEEYISKLQEWQTYYENIQKQITSQLLTEAKYEFNKICGMAVDHFYNSYSPRYYRRFHDLYNAYSININKDEGWMEIIFDSDLMQHTHRVDNEYIFNISFMGVESLTNNIVAYHGGADHIDKNKESKWGKHPDPGIYYWRKPPMVHGVKHPYTRWGNPATFTTISPREEIHEKMQIKWEELMSKYQKKYNKKEKYIEKNIISIIEEYFNI